MRAWILRDERAFDQNDIRQVHWELVLLQDLPDQREIFVRAAQASRHVLPIAALVLQDEAVHLLHELRRNAVDLCAKFCQQRFDFVLDEIALRASNAQAVEHTLLQFVRPVLIFVQSVDEPVYLSRTLDSRAQAGLNATDLAVDVALFTFENLNVP